VRDYERQPMKSAPGDAYLELPYRDVLGEYQLNFLCRPTSAGWINAKKRHAHDRKARCVALSAAGGESGGNRIVHERPRGLISSDPLAIRMVRTLVKTIAPRDFRIVSARLTVSREIAR
jgi:hypothetical protein